jgi:hypothetical protein
VPRRQSLNKDTECRRVRHVVRDRHRELVGDPGVLRVPAHAAVGKPDDPPPVADPCTRDLGAQDLGQVRGRPARGAALGVEEVHARPGHLDQGVPEPDGGPGHALDGEDLRSTECADDHGTHQLVRPCPAANHCLHRFPSTTRR